MANIRIAGTDDAPAAEAAESVWHNPTLRRFMKNRLAVLAAAWLAVVVVASFVGPMFTQDPNHANVLERLKPPSLEHIFGTDQLGRDVFARVLIGGRVSLTTAFLATAVALFIGMIIGTLSGYRGGLLDEVLARTFDILTTFPTLLVGIIIVVALGPSLTSVVIAVAFTDVPLYGRLFRAGALSVKNQEFVQGVVALGFSPARIVVKHVLPNITIPVLVVAAGAMGRAALAEASLSFLGAGIQPPTASWGNMMADGQPFLQIYPWFPIIPGTILTTMTIAFSFVGDALRDAFDFRESGSAESNT